MTLPPPTTRSSSASRAVRWSVFGLGTLIALAVGCSRGGTAPEEFDPITSIPAEMIMRSPAFPSGAAIPSEFSCDGADHSPPVEWGTPPLGTEALVLIMDDPDAPGGIFTHWTLYNLPASTRQLGAGTPGDPEIAGGARQGANDFGSVGYRGPCPPRGETHEYRLLLFALNAPLALEPSAPPIDVIRSLRGSVIGRGEYFGIYARQ